MNTDLYQRLWAGETLTHLLSPRALWRLSGPDAERYLNGQVTNDISRLQDGQGCSAAVCTAKGRMEGDVFVARHGAEYYLDAAGELRESLGPRLEKYLIADDALLEDVTDEWTLRHVFGPKASPQPEKGFVIPHSRYGLPGCDVWRPGEGAIRTDAALEAEVIDLIRLEHGIPLWGAELNANTLPPEAGPSMLAAISYTKGCYVGQETIARLKSVGHVNRTLVFLAAKGDRVPAPRSRILLEGRDVGEVTSSGYSPRLQQAIALAYVHRTAAMANSLLHCGDIPMTITAPLSSANP